MSVATQEQVVRAREWKPERDTTDVVHNIVFNALGQCNTSAAAPKSQLPAHVEHPSGSTKLEASWASAAIVQATASSVSAASKEMLDGLSRHFCNVLFPEDLLPDRQQEGQVHMTGTSCSCT